MIAGATAILASITIPIGPDHAISLLRPEVLWALLLVPGVWLMGWLTRQEISRGRLFLAVALRTLGLLAVCLALAGPTLDRQVARRAVIYLLDVSASVPRYSLEQARGWIAASAGSLADEDLAAVVAFDGETRPVIPFTPAHELTLEDLPPRGSPAATGRTNIAGALRTAQAMLPQGWSGRIVVLTDGNENRGQAEDQVARLTSAGVGVSVLALERPDEEPVDVLLESLEFPSARAREGEAVEGRIIAHATAPVKGTLQIFRNGLLEVERQVSLEAGRNPPITFPQQIDRKGLFTYEASFHADGDQRPENDRALGFLSVEGSPRVLIIEQRESQARHLASALEQGRMTVSVRDAAGVPRDMADLEGFDVVIFSDVPAVSSETGVSISVDQMKLIRNYVHEFGGGFIMIGGENSFGLGGYYRTPIEECLPVRMEIPKKIEIPSIAIALVLDKSGSMNGAKVELAKEAARRVVDILKDRDFIAVVTFDSGFHWNVPMTRCIEKPRIVDAIGRIAAGGGTFMYPALEQAYQELRKAPAKLKHMIVLTDGQTNPADHDSLLRRMTSERITVSSVGIGEGADRALLERIAKLGNGRHYFTTDFQNIPQIFVQETIKASRSAITEDPFRPKRLLNRPYVSGIAFESGPPLLGYVTTKAKETAEVVLVSPHEDPLLAVWQHGLGKTAAFTSDAKARWASGWIRWDGYTKLWSQLIRAVMRPRRRHDLQGEVQVEDGVVRLTVDAVNENGAFINDARLTAEVYYWQPPDADAEEGLQASPSPATPDALQASDAAAEDHALAQLELAQVAPGRYEAHLSTQATGGYLVKFRDETGLVETQGYAISWSPEYAHIGVDETHLRRLAATAGSELNAAPERAVAEARRDTASRESLVGWLIAAAALLLVLDLAIRRLGSWREVLPW